MIGHLWIYERKWPSPPPFPKKKLGPSNKEDPTKFEIFPAPSYKIKKTFSPHKKKYLWVRGVNEYTYLSILSHLFTRFPRVKIFIAVLVPSSTQVDHVIICINVPSMLLSLLSLLHSMFCVVFLCPWNHLFLGIIFLLEICIHYFNTGSFQVPPEKNYHHTKCQFPHKIAIWSKSLLYKPSA